jgi:hypothetical protein
VFSEPSPYDRPRISWRLQHALVADEVVEDLSTEADELLEKRIVDQTEWTEHLGRQLDIKTYGRGDVHSTLLTLIPLLDELVRAWPPGHDPAVCRRLAEEACKNLSPFELYATLLAGPARWRTRKIAPGCTVDRLPVHLKPILEAALAAELDLMLGKWVQWDIPKIKERRKEALKASEKIPVKAERAPTPRVRPPRGETDHLKDLFVPRGRT